LIVNCEVSIQLTCVLKWDALMCLNAWQFSENHVVSVKMKQQLFQPWHYYFLNQT